ncbi:SpoIIE family protein phosphatase [Streptomyces anandii]|uniref:SpoIIE family protein phosphatase n=1 Tax=Streptomyces anandii TaxID=285454 RepID=A0ABW6HCB9_9ACTN
MSTVRRRARPEAAHARHAEALDSVLADVVSLTGASVGLLFLLPPGERMLRLAAASGASRRIAAPWERVPLQEPVPVADAMRTRRLVWLGSQEELARRYPRLGIILPYDFMLAAAPIADDETVWGGIVLLWPVWHPPQLSAAERETIEACCRRGAGVLRGAAGEGLPLLTGDEPRLLSSPVPRESDPAQAAAALGFAQRLPVGCCALDLDGRITFINSAAAELVGAGAAALLGRRPWEVLLWLRDPVFEDRYREAVVARLPTSFTARRPPGTRLSFQLYPDHGGISVLITPASAPARPSSAEPAGPECEPPPAQPPPRAEPLGATALYSLTHLASALAEAAGVRDVGELVADQIVPAFGPSAMALLAAEDGRLRVITHRGWPGDLVDRFDAAPLTSGSLTAQVLTSGAPRFLGGVADVEPARAEVSHLDAMAAWAFLPLIASGRPIGTLVLGYDRPQPFAPAERALLTSLAGLLAQSLARARHYDAKHSLAHALQNSLLPRALPRVPGLATATRYLPAGDGLDIGGDFYDLIRCDPDSAVAAVGDVQGHNPTAAALMGQVRTAVHAQATGGASPGDVLARTNRLLTDLESGLFTSCLIAHLEPGVRRARFANAGHPPPLLRHPDGRTEVVDVPPGLLLGIDPDAGYTTVPVTLPPGAVLALYTDGLVEAPGVDLDEATGALVRELARAGGQEDLEDVADALVRHARRSAPRHDDIALILLRTEPDG